MKTIALPTDVHKLIIEHVRQTVDEANAGKIPIPKAVAARVILSQVTAYVNNQITRQKTKGTMTPVVKQMIAVAMEHITKSFQEQGIPLPSKLIDTFTGGQVHFRPVWTKAEEVQFTVDQLQSLPGKDEATKAAIETVITSLQGALAH